MFLSHEYQIDKEILNKCNPGIWDWTDEALNHYKSIVKKYYSKDESFISAGLKKNGCDSSFLILADESMLNKEEIILEAVSADVREKRMPCLQAGKELLNSVDFLKKVISISGEYIQEILENDQIENQTKKIFKKTI